MQSSSLKAASPPPSKPSARAPAPSTAGATLPWGNALPRFSQRAEIKRASILREAARSFNRAGSHGTSMEDIAKRLCGTKPALYRYVRNKHEVLFASFSLGLDSGCANLDRAEKSGSNGFEKVRIALRGYLEDIVVKLGYPAVLLEESALLPEQERIVIGRRDGVEKRFRALINEGVQDGSIADCDPKLAVLALLGAVSWVPKWYRDDGDWSAAQVVESLVDLILRSIASRDTPEPPTRGSTRA